MQAFNTNNEPSNEKGRAQIITLKDEQGNEQKIWTQEDNPESSGDMIAASLELPAMGHRSVASSVTWVMFSALVFRIIRRVLTIAPSGFYWPIGVLVLLLSLGFMFWLWQGAYRVPMPTWIYRVVLFVFGVGISLI